MIEAYPLSWPAHKPRTTSPKTSRFDTPLCFARDGLLEEIRLLGGQLSIISTNIPLRKDGLPYANYSPPQDKGVAVYFQIKGKPMCFTCDAWDKIEDNMQAIRKTIEALRGIERWGGLAMQQEAFAGFTALPPPPSNVWGVILGVSQDCSLSEAENAYRTLAKKAHPDCGGSIDQMHRLNGAIAEARRAKGE